MKKIFLLTAIITSFIACNSDSGKTLPVITDDNPNLNGELGPITGFLIRLVDSEGNWIEGIEEKEMKLLVADSDWNILNEQPDNTPGVFYDHSLWGIGKEYNWIGNGKEEFIGGKKELLYIVIVTSLKNLSYFEKNDDTYGEYLVLQIDENTSLYIQLFYKEYHNFAGHCIEKFICNGKEYMNLEYVGVEGNKALMQNTHDIVIE